MSFKPYALAVDYGGDQFPVCGRSPRLSWKNPTEIGNQLSYEVRVEINGTKQKPVRVDSASHLYVPWPWGELHSMERVSWRVRVAGSQSVSAFSEPAAFEVGLLDADWRATWISPAEPADAGPGQRPAYALHRTFHLAGAVTDARLYATALGVYEVYLNGGRVGSSELNPGHTSYDRTLYGQAWDVSDALRPGDNQLTLVLGDGWYRGEVGAFRIPAGWGTVLGARAELYATGPDGSRDVVVRTDGAWQWSGCEVTRASLMDGESVDFGAVALSSQPVLVDQVSGPPLDYSPAPPVRCVETRPVVSLNQLTSTRYIADFGQNSSGWVRLDNLGPAGALTTIDYGEHLGPDGDLSTTHLDSVRPGEAPMAFRQHDEVRAGAEEHVFEPRLTVHGFRYARIDRHGPLSAGDVSMRVVHSDLRPTGVFACSDERVTRLWEIARSSFVSNAVDIPTDCPTRERLGWSGDYQVFVSTATRLYDVAGFTRKWLRSVRDDQLADGRIANFSPDGRRIKLHLDDQMAQMTGSAGWGDAITQVPWEIFRAYGDKQVLAENVSAMRRWVEWALAAAASHRHPSRAARSLRPLPHERYVWDGTFHWGEWAEPKARATDGSFIDPVQADPMAWFMADKGEVGTAYLYRSLVILSAACAVLGLNEEAARYGATATQVAEAWRTEFLDEEGHTAGDTQASYVRALSFGLIPAGLRAAAVQRLVELIANAGGHLTTGFLSTGDLLPVLADCGFADVAYDLLYQSDSPSWLAMVDRGATTIWEDWDGIDENGHAHDSLNHYSKGAVIRFLHSHTLGLRQGEGSVAWESIVIAPVPDQRLSWAAGALETPQGLIEVAWNVSGAEFCLDVTVPAGCSAQVVFPDGARCRVGPGRYAGARPVGGVREVGAGETVAHMHAVTDASLCTSDR